MDAGRVSLWLHKNKIQKRKREHLIVKIKRHTYSRLCGSKFRAETTSHVARRYSRSLIVMWVFDWPRTDIHDRHTFQRHEYNLVPEG